MTMRHSLGLLALSTAFLACSSQYYEVGGMDGTAGAGATGARGPAGGEVPEGALAGSRAVGATGTGGTMSAGEGMPVGEFGPQCAPSGAPPQLAGQFAEPAVIWSRVAMLTWGEVIAPPYGLPEETSYSWAGDVARAALVNANDALGRVPGVETFLRQWLAFPATSSFQHAWSESVVTTNPVLSELLLQQVGDEWRVGIFTEPTWLAAHRTISARGVEIERALFNVLVPPPPDGIENPKPNPNLTERASLEVATGQPVCSGCHSQFDQSGFALGRFAADGTFRELDNGKPIDTTGSRSAGSVRDFDGIEEFGLQFAGSCEATLGFADQFLLTAMAINDVPDARREALYEASRARVEQAFVHDGRTYEAAVKAYIQSPAGLRP
jgi:Protein of unknown function (DUF1588)